MDGDLEKILPLVRQACELGADIIKADPTDDVGVYRKVVSWMASGAASTRVRTHSLRFSMPERKPRSLKKRERRRHRSSGQIWS